MNRKTMKKFVNITLAAAMTAGLAVTGSAEEEGTINYPLETEDQISIWSSSNLKPVSTYLDWTESPFHTGLEKKTGVKTEWNFVTEGADEASAFNLLFTEDELPDVIFYFLGATEAQEYVEDGRFMICQNIFHNMHRIIGLI